MASSPHHNRNLHSKIVFTACDGRLVSSIPDPNSHPSTHKLHPSLMGPPQLQQKQNASHLPLPSQSRPPSAPLTELHNLHEPALPLHLRSPARSTPSKPPRPSNFGIQSLPRTPSTSQRKARLPPSAKKVKLKAAIKLKALESQMIDDSRHEQDRKELWLDMQEKAYCAWLNHVLLKPMKSKRAVGHIDLESASTASNGSSRVSSMGDLSNISSNSALAGTEKPSGPDNSASPAARQTPRGNKRNTLKSHVPKAGKENLSFDASFQAICSITVLRQRLEPFLDAKSRDDVILTMINLVKHVDEGRIKMKDGCPVVTDVALKEKFLHAMLSYNTQWLKIGLFVVLGHSALLTKDQIETLPETLEQQQEEEEEDEDSQRTILRMIIEKHFLAHPGLAKYHATNKTIEGLYKAGYHGALGRVILKRILLLVLALDKAKCQNTLRLACGIDGLDGGSPLLFHVNGSIKSSQQAVQEFLLNAMHGEGDVVGHLGVLGYHVSHVQAGLADYRFDISNLIEDLQDGVRFCRLAQVLLSDASILVEMKFPSNHPRRHSHNCGISLERLARAGIPLVDDHGYATTADDVVDGNRERVLSLLWNIMLHLQIPLLVNVQKIQQEILRIQSYGLDSSGTSNGSSPVELLLEWAQGRYWTCVLQHRVEVVCAKYGFQVQNFTSSFADGQAFCYLISHYFPMLLPHTAVQGLIPSSPQKRNQCSAEKAESSALRISVIQNFNLCERAILKLGCIPEVLQLTQLSDIDSSVCERNIVILLAFLSHRLLEDIFWITEKMDALSWDAGLAFQKLSEDIGLRAGSFDNPDELMAWQGSAAIKIQSTFKGFLQRKEFRKNRRAATRIQTTVRKWLASRLRASQTPREAGNSYVSLNSAAVVIQSHFRGRRARLQHKLYIARIYKIQRFWRERRGRLIFLAQSEACFTIQRSWRKYLVRKMAMMKQSEITLAMTIVQAWWRMCCTRKKFLQQRAAVVIIQSCLRSYTQRKRFRNYKESALKLQAFVRSRYARHRYCEYRDSVQKIQRCWRGVLAARSAKQKHEEMLIAVTRIQASWRKYLQRKSFLQKKAAATRLQSIFRSHQQRKAYTKLKNCAVKLQSLVRRRSKRRNYCRYVESVKKIQRCWKLALATRSAQRKRAESNNAATRIQAWWRQCAARRSFLELRADAVHLQRCIRSYIRRKEYKRYRERVVKVQALFRGRQERRKYIEYKDAALKIQAHVRVKKSLRACQNSAARKIQAAWRTMRLNKAATIIQARYRGWWQKQRYKVQVKQIIELKAVVKGKHLPCQFLQQVPAGTTTEQYCCGDIVDSTNKACNVASISFLLEEHGLKKNGNSPLSRPLTDKEHALSDGKSAAKSDGNSYEVIRRSIRTALQRRWFLQLRKCTLTLQRRWRCLLQRRRDAVTTIQRHFRGWQQRKGFYQKRMAIKNIQACWRGHLARQSHGHMKHQLLDLRQRMQNTAANVDNRMRLENRLTEALAALLSQKTVSGILHTCATIDLATQHSKLCCERLLEAGAIPKLLQLIQTTNRSPPHQEVLKHALSILASIGRYSEFATLVADAPRFIATVADQLLRNDDEVLTKVIKLLKLACKVPSGLQMVQKNPAVLRRLYSVSQALEKKVEVEARTLARLPTSASLIVRRSGEKKVSDAVAQHYSVVSLLQAVTGEDLQTRLKAVRRMSSIYQVPPPPRLSICRFPLQDCSNK